MNVRVAIFWTVKTVLVWRIANCEFEMRLENDYGYEMEGVLLMNISGTWGSVTWVDDVTMKTVCKLMGYGFVGFKALKANNNHPLLVSDLACSGTEDTITDCNMTVSNIAAAPNTLPAIHCFEHNYTDIRLVGGLTTNQGQVIVKMNGRYGAVCSREPGNEAARDVLCRTLGYPAANTTNYQFSLNSSISGLYSDPFIDLRFGTCTGNESNFADCAIQPEVEFLGSCAYMYNAEEFLADCLAVELDEVTTKPNDTIEPPTKANTVENSTSLIPNNGDVPVETIVASVVGGVCCIAVIVVLILYCRYRRKQKGNTEKDRPAVQGNRKTVNTEIHDTVKQHTEENESEYHTIGPITRDRSSYMVLAQRNKRETPYNFLEGQRQQTKTENIPEYLDLQSSYVSDGYVEPDGYIEPKLTRASEKHTYIKPTEIRTTTNTEYDYVEP